MVSTMPNELKISFLVESGDVRSLDLGEHNARKAIDSVMRGTTNLERLNHAPMYLSVNQFGYEQLLAYVNLIGERHYGMISKFWDMDIVVNPAQTLADIIVLPEPTTAYLYSYALYPEFYDNGGVN